ncbi:hypothetical protein RND71_026082 [Anisodus tanguticus]|uniref:Core domain-containing protein n=1 Tax=Anisodus tanguticus TaxID=243964 RepID=A0AAE1V2I8_9SOLA|nr:hypothetical protein RND71_026082 [Anisodus tanguticus]
MSDIEIRIVDLRSKDCNSLIDMLEGIAWVLIDAAAPASGGVAPAVSLTDNALKHLNKMRSERNEDLCLIIGVKQGGCSGMSYTMEFDKRENARPDDSIIEYNGFVIGMCQFYLSLFNMPVLVFFFHVNDTPSSIFGIHCNR